MGVLGLVVISLNFFLLINCGYPPTGDEVTPGSVLLPASRRGRYLANIVRRQAVDGTGIKFNKDADRMNAEAKKKVDVLSEELLPYIIAEQERRTTLYKRVMTAIQNGEKGVTIAEIRNKPPLIIRKGLMFRCPMNRAPKEPDGSGIIMCEDDIEPSTVMFDSCLSAEDKDLYVADNKYFFCNRHKVEGPDLPRNGSTVIGCAPMERTSLNYTSAKCALEDTDDVVVHYRYYPDRTYKFVTELDPDREVCEHWNPCQIGYIYSLPSPDQALPANELWHDYVEKHEEVANDEFVPSIPEDSIYEHVPNSMTGKTYTPIPRRLRAPPGYQFDGVWTVKDPYSKKNRRRCFGYKGLFGGGCDGGAGGGGYGGSGGFGVGGGGGFSISGGLSISSGVSVTHGIGFRGGIEKLTGGRDGGAKTGSGVDNSRFKLSPDKYSFELSADGVFLFIALKLEWDSSCLGPYYAVFTKEANGRKMEKSLDIVHLEKATVQIPEIKELDLTAGQRAAPQTVQFKCSRCELTRIMVRSDDYNIYNLDTSRYKVTTEDGLNTIEIDLDTVKPKDVGYYTAVFRNEDNNEENVQIIKVDSPRPDLENRLRIKRLVLSAKTGEHVDKTLKYECTDCEVTDVVCNGESVTAAGRVSIVNSSKIISFSFPSFEDSNSCVYCGLFKKDNKIYRIVLAVIDSASPAVTVTGAFPITSPPLGEQFEAEVPIQCDECTLEKVLVNGVMLDMAPTRRNSADTPAYYIATPTSITIRVNEFSATYEGVYQAVFDIKGEQVTKTILEIRNPHDKSAAPDHGTPGDQITTVATPGEITTVLPGSSTAIETSTEAAEGSESTTASEQGSASTTAPEQGFASTTAPEQGSASSTEAEQDSTSEPTTAAAE